MEKKRYIKGSEAAMRTRVALNYCRFISASAIRSRINWKKNKQ